jgi:adenine phosphoribosyltransferase
VERVSLARLAARHDAPKKQDRNEEPRISRRAALLLIRAIRVPLLLDQEKTMNADKLKVAIRDVADFPKPGIIFKDITPILSDPKLFRLTIDILAQRHKEQKIDKIAAIDARGFLFAGALCLKLKAGLVPIRKKGKLPWKTFEKSYDLEYGSATLAIHQDAFKPGDRVVLLDDLLATGGTAAASVKLIEQAGGKVVGVDFVVELAFLNGRKKLGGYDVFAPVVF